MCNKNTILDIILIVTSYKISNKKWSRLMSKINNVHENLIYCLFINLTEIRFA